MMHVGFEPSPILGAKRQLGDTWKMLKWQFSGKLGGNRREINDGRDDGYGPGKNTPMPPPPDLVSSDGRLRVL
jgi:hypothetical protein